METALVAKKIHANLALGSRISQPKAEKGAHQGELAALEAACAAGRPLSHCGSSAAAQTAACGRLCVIRRWQCACMVAVSLYGGSAFV
jgi:hypothetical protein